MQQNKQFKYGLNLPTKQSKQLEKTLKRSSILTEEGDDDDITTTDQPFKKLSSSKKVNKPSFNRDISSSKIVQEQYKAALEEDPTVYSYDEVYDDMKNAERKTLQELKGIESVSSKKPRYVNDLLKAAEIRKRDYIRAQERKVQKEREAEGDEFDDKETFVTPAYKAQQEELRKAEEEEKKREKKDAYGTKDTTKFYRNLLDQASTAKSAAIEASRLALSSDKKRTFSEDDDDDDKLQKTDKELAEEARASGKIVMLNDDDQIVDKRQLLSAGLNITKKKNTSSSKSSSSSTKDYYDYRSHDSIRGGDSDKSKYYEEMRRRERQSRELEKQILEAERKKEEEERKKEEELAKKLSIRKNDEKAISDARTRYLARQKEKKELKKLKVEEDEVE